MVSKRIFGAAAAMLLGLGATNPAHAIFASDLDIFLTHGNTTVQLFQGAEDDTFSNDGFSLIFDDESANPHTGSDPFPPDMNPFEPLSAFDGQELSGEWGLSFLDDFVPDEGDELVGWRLFGTFGRTNALPFEVWGPPAVNIDVDPAAMVALTIDQFQGPITDLNVELILVEGNLTDDVPEPATMLLLGAGMLGLGAMRRRAAA